MFAALGASLIDTDQIAHQLTSPGGLAMPAIVEQFGAGFVTVDGAMDRARMRAEVFSDPAVKRRLEAILHPLIRIETERAAREAQGVYRIFVVPLLVESGKWKERVSRVLVVDCPEALQISRVLARNRLPAAQVRAIMAAQATRQARLAAADDVIVNDGGIAQLTPQVERLHALYSAMAQGKLQAD
jgi:dephospho-CoA kinase